MTEPRRYPIAVGDTIRHIDGRSGVIEALVEVGNLPGARVRFGDGTQDVPLGYLQWIGSAEIE